MSFEITGNIVAIYPTTQRTETFRTREFVIEKQDDIGSRVISNYIKFQCVQDRTAVLDNLSVGESVKVHFNIKGTKWVKDGRENYITNLDAWRIERFAGEAPAENKAQPQPPVQTQPADADDLPF